MGKKGTGDRKLKFPIQPSSSFPIFLPHLQTSPTARTDYWPLDLTISRNQVRVRLWNFQLIMRRRVMSHYHGGKFLNLNKRYDDGDGVTLSDFAFNETSDRLSKLTHFALCCRGTLYWSWILKKKVPSLKRKREIRHRMYTLLIKHGITCGQFTSSCRSSAVRAKECTKNCAAHAKLLFW